MAYTRWMFRKFERQYGERVVVYIHPWEIDSEQPRISGNIRSKLRHYTNLVVMENRVKALLFEFKFRPFKELLGSTA